MPKQRTQVALIPLSRGRHAIVDAGDFSSLSQHKWHLEIKRAKYRTYLYARRNVERCPGRTPGTIAMHREILGLKPGDRRDVDHRNGDGLDNRRANLRIATRSLNAANKRCQANKAASRFKGVHRDGRRFRAQVGSAVLGHFSHEQDAALAYNRGAARAYGEFAHPNDTADWTHIAPELPLT